MRTNFFGIAGMLVLSIFFTSCGTSKARFSSEKNTTTSVRAKNTKVPPAQVEIKTADAEDEPADNRVFNITSFAKAFQGTRYKYGGTTEEGMDCSGLVYTSFLQEEIPLPRSSREMAKEGNRLSLEEVNIGDLLFFETDKNKKVINHVGLVVEIQPGHILFIHSTSSRGVIISSLAENYWFDHFVMARRVI